MSEQDQAPEATTTTEAPNPGNIGQPKASTDAPDGNTPRGIEGDFNPERALEAIQAAKREARALRDRTKAAEAKAATVDEIQRRATDLEAQLVRERVARRLSLPDELVDRLRGATEDEVMADAEKLVALVAPKQRPAAAAARPVESLQPGSGVAASGPAQLSRADMAGMTADQIVAAKAAGQFDTLLGIKTA